MEIVYGAVRRLGILIKSKGGKLSFWKLTPSQFVSSIINMIKLLNILDFCVISHSSQLFSHMKWLNEDGKLPGKCRNSISKFNMAQSGVLEF